MHNGAAHSKPAQSWRYGLDRTGRFLLRSRPAWNPVAAVRTGLACALASLPAEDLARLEESARQGMSLPKMSEFAGTVGGARQAR